MKLMMMMEGEWWGRRWVWGAVAAVECRNPEGCSLLTGWGMRAQRSLTDRNTEGVQKTVKSNQQISTQAMKKGTEPLRFVSPFDGTSVSPVLGATWRSSGAALPRFEAASSVWLDMVTLSHSGSQASDFCGEQGSAWPLRICSTEKTTSGCSTALQQKTTTMMMT